MEKLPEICISKVISLTSPKDACRLSLVDTTFNRAAEFDQVWENFLPTDYKAMISEAANPPNADELKTSKQLYFWLCNNPLFIDQGTKSFSLDKSSGKKCYMIAARDLNMTPSSYGYTSPFSELVSEPDSRFSEVAKLDKVNEVEIRGKMSINLLSDNTTYSAFLVYKLQGGGSILRRSKLRRIQIDASEQCGMSQFCRLRVPGVLNGVNNNTEIQDEIIGSPYTRKREDGWWEVKFRDYYNGSSADGKDDDLNLKVIMGSIWSSNLMVQGIEIRPKLN